MYLTSFQGEKYPTYPRIVKWLVILDAHFKEAQRGEENTPNFNQRIVQMCKDMVEATARCVAKLNEDAYIAALLHIGIRDTFFSRPDCDKYWGILESLYRSIRL